MLGMEEWKRIAGGSACDVPPLLAPHGSAIACSVGWAAAHFMMAIQPQKNLLVLIHDACRGQPCRHAGMDEQHFIMHIMLRAISLGRSCSTTSAARLTMSMASYCFAGSTAPVLLCA